jgi:hypothetical protein
MSGKGAGKGCGAEGVLPLTPGMTQAQGMSKEEITKLQVPLKVIYQTNCPRLSGVTIEVRAGNKVGTLVKNLAQAVVKEQLPFLNGHAYLDGKTMVLESTGQMMAGTDYVTHRLEIWRSGDHSNYERTLGDLGLIVQGLAKSNMLVISVTGSGVPGSAEVMELSSEGEEGTSGHNAQDGFNEAALKAEWFPWEAEGQTKEEWLVRQTNDSRQCLADERDQLKVSMGETAASCRSMCVNSLNMLKHATEIQQEFMKTMTLKRKHEDAGKVIEDEKTVKDYHGAFGSLASKHWEHESMGQPLFLQHVVRNSQGILWRGQSRSFLKYKVS